MGTLKWYKRDPRAALIGMMGLTLEECGAYNTVLDLLYCRDGILVDDPREIAKWMRCDIRTWKAIRLRLISKGKLYVHNGCLRNERADEEIRSAIDRVSAKRRSSLDRWATYRNIKGLQTRDAVTTTTRKKESLSATVVPIAKRPSEVSKQELEEQFERKRGAAPPPDISRET
jgi:uncharacterized protein YdaU (DUF1376 family)